MRDPKRITPMLELIDAIWKKSPDLRLCQILSNGAKYADWSHGDLFHLEDEDLAEGLMLLEAELHLLTQYTVTINDDAEWNKPWSSFEDHVVTDITSQECKDQRAEFWRTRAKLYHCETCGQAEGEEHLDYCHRACDGPVADDRLMDTPDDSLTALAKQATARANHPEVYTPWSAFNDYFGEYPGDKDEEEPAVESKGLPWGVVTQ